ncbi:hypothetical protein BDQ17DRAFT_551033 [Cyathus striatus]|nr:hypothetical protein BDQ17DRAFT_551033 [Cyathus striatus]
MTAPKDSQPRSNIFTFHRILTLRRVLAFHRRLRFSYIRNDDHNIRFAIRIHFRLHVHVGLHISRWLRIAIGPIRRDREILRVLGGDGLRGLPLVIGKIRVLLAIGIGILRVRRDNVSSGRWVPEVEPLWCGDLEPSSLVLEEEQRLRREECRILRRGR